MQHENVLGCCTVATVEYVMEHRKGTHNGFCYNRVLALACVDWSMKQDDPVLYACTIGRDKH
jgi:hypothetical protein